MGEETWSVVNEVASELGRESEVQLTEAEMDRVMMSNRRQLIDKEHDKSIPKECRTGVCSHTYKCY